MRLYKVSVITAVTSQNTQVASLGIHDIPLFVIKSQIKSVIDDIDIRVIKTGMLNNPNLIKFIGKNLSHKKLIVDSNGGQQKIFAKNHFAKLLKLTSAKCIFSHSKYI